MPRALQIVLPLLGRVDVERWLWLIRSQPEQYQGQVNLFVWVEIQPLFPCPTFLGEEAEHSIINGIIKTALLIAQQEQSMRVGL